MKPTTPWGEPQQHKLIADGITRFDTASHGGLSLDAQRIAQMPKALRVIMPFAGPGWYEEDCDWAIVALAFPEHFDERAIVGAFETAHLDYVSWGAAARDWLTSTPEGKAITGRANAWKEANGHKFRTGSAGTGGDGWIVSASNIAGTESIRFAIPSNGYYDLQEPYTVQDALALGAKIIDREART